MDNTVEIQSMSHDREDLIVWDYFQKHLPRHRYLVDVGAAQKMLSNTWAILNQGWTGLLIDADPRTEELMRRDFSGMDVKIVICGVAHGEFEADFYDNKVRQSSSFVSSWDTAGRTGRKWKLRVRPLADILDEHLVPKDFDYLSVDTEGMDNLILSKMLNESHYRPQVIVTEKGKEKNRTKFFEHFGYRLLAHTHKEAGLYSNLIYVRE